MGCLSVVVGMLLLSIASCQPTSYYDASVENFRLLNEFRVSEGSQALVWDDTLYELALTWSRHMYEVQRLYHSDYGHAENVAYTYNKYTPSSVAQGFFTQWETSTKGHRENMLHGSHKCGAVAIYGDGTTYYGTQIFIPNCGATVSAPSAFYEASLHNFELANGFRASEGEAGLLWDPALYELAMNWSAHMFEAEKLYHSQYGLAENVAYAFNAYTADTVAQEFFNQWEASIYGHRENMLFSTHKCGAAAIYGDGSTFYGTQLFVPSCTVVHNSPEATPLSTTTPNYQSMTPDPTRTPMASQYWSMTPSPYVSPGISPVGSPAPTNPKASYQVSPSQTPEQSPSESNNPFPSSPDSTPMQSYQPMPSRSPEKSPMSTPVESYQPMPSRSPEESPTKSMEPMPSSTPSWTPVQSYEPMPSTSPEGSPISTPVESYQPMPSRSPEESPTKSMEPMPSSTPSWTPMQSYEPMPSTSPEESPAESVQPVPSASPMTTSMESMLASPSKSPGASPTESMIPTPTKGHVENPSESTDPTANESPVASPSRNPTQSINPDISTEPQPTEFPAPSFSATPTVSSAPTTSPTPSITPTPPASTSPAVGNFWNPNITKKEARIISKMQ